MSLGASRAGFAVGAAFEWDPIALSSHAINFPGSLHSAMDVSLLSGEDIVEPLNGQALTGLVGGPPCQGFSTIGKRIVDDPRNSLFGHFFRLVKETQPAFYVAENVPGILNPRNAEVVRAALESVPSHYRVLKPRVVVASDFGVPTSRKRVFFVGYDPARLTDLCEEALFAAVGYRVTVAEALAGLPSVRASWQGAQQGWRKIGAPSGHLDFQQRLTGHVPDGVGSPAALLALAQRSVSGNLGTVHQPDVVDRFRRVKWGATDPISRAPKLHPGGFCPTLRAGTNSDRGSFQAVRPIHYSRPRVITPREAARLQGFPDWFQFHGTKWHSFRQIGNSVSPGVAEILLSRLRARLR